MEEYWSDEDGSSVYSDDSDYTEEFERGEFDVLDEFGHLVHINGYTDSSSESDESDESDETDVEDNEEVDAYNQLSTYDQMFREDEDLVDQDKTHDQYYISSVHLQASDHIMSMVVSPRVFYKYSIKLVLKYLYVYSAMLGVPKNSIEIVRLNLLPDGTHQCILKTFWLRLFQRHWRKLYRERERVLENRMQYESLRYFECHGVYPEGSRHLPKYRGMLSMYTKSPL